MAINLMTGSTVDRAMDIRSILNRKPVRTRRNLQPWRGEAADESPQAYYEERVSSGIPLTADEVLEAKQYAASIGTTFDAVKGFGALGAFKAKLDESSGGGSTGQGGSSFMSPKPAQKVPADIRTIMAKGGPTNEDDAKRLARWQNSTQGKLVSGAGEGAADRSTGGTGSYGGDSAARNRRAGGTGSYAGDSAARNNRAGGNARDDRVQALEFVGTQSGAEAAKYRAQLGGAYRALQEQADSETGNVSRAAMAERAGVSKDTVDTAIAQGEARMNEWRAELGIPQKPSERGPKPAESPDQMPEYFFAEGNADGSVSTYQGKSASVAEARGREVKPAPGMKTPRPQPQIADKPLDEEGNPKQFKARI